MKNKSLIITEDIRIQTSGPDISAFVRTSPIMYYNTLNGSTYTNDTNDMTVINGISRKYSKAWKKLAEL